MAAAVSTRTKSLLTARSRPRQPTPPPSRDRCPAVKGLRGRFHSVHGGGRAECSGGRRNPGSVKLVETGLGAPLDQTGVRSPRPSDPTPADDADAGARLRRRGPRPAAQNEMLRRGESDPDGLEGLLQRSGGSVRAAGPGESWWCESRRRRA